MSQTIQIPPMVELEARLVQKLEEKKAQGWEIDPHTAFNTSRCVCCLLGAQIADLDERMQFGSYRDAACRRLGINEHRALALELGFMGMPNQIGEPQYYQLGAKLRAKYLS